MERLTMRVDNGLEEIYFYNPDDPEGEYTLSDIAKNGHDDICDQIANRLAAYEDTGLTPEEVKQLIVSDESKEQSSIEWFNRAKELQDKLNSYKQAEADGRIVVLPF